MPRPVRERGFFTYRGRDSIPYFTGTSHISFSVTEPDGTVVTIYANGVDKDQRIVDNGDGTFAITTRSAGGFRVVGPDGTLRNPGMLLGQITVNTNGTPQDPFDDAVVTDFAPLQPSTGLNELGGQLLRRLPPSDRPYRLSD